MSNYPYDDEYDNEYDDEYDDGEDPVDSDSEEAWSQLSWQRGPHESEEDYQDRMDGLSSLLG